MTRHRLPRGWWARSLVVLATTVGACGPNPSPPVRELPAKAINLRLDRLECHDQNDAAGADDEVYVRMTWTGVDTGEARLPADGGRWRMCGETRTVSSDVLRASLPPGRQIVVRVSVGEDDQQADRVSNQIDDTLARFNLVLHHTDDGKLDVTVEPLPIEDNNAVALLPPLEVELDTETRALGFTSAYRNADGDVRYEGRLIW